MIEMNGLEDWNLVRSFLAVARGGTLAEGAELVGASTATLHRQLAALEEALEVRLFERRGRRRLLTAAGEALLERASAVEAEMVALERAVGGRDESLQGTVVLTTTDTFAHVLLSRYLPALRERYPGVHLQVLVDNRHYRLGRGEADVALRPGAKPTEPDVVAVRVTELAAGWYASNSYLERHGRPRRRADLMRHDAAVVDESLAHVLFGRLAAEHTDPARWVLRSPSLLVLAEAVRAGIGVAALPCFLMDVDPKVERLFAPEPEGPLWLIYHADLRRTARVRAVVDFLGEQLEADAGLLGGEGCQR